jgi:anti-sigma B factor antagonist
MSVKHGTQWLEREDFDAVTVVRLKPPETLDDDTARAMFDLIYTLCDTGRTRLVLNLADVEYLTSMALGKLVMLNRKVQAAGGRLALCQLVPFTREILDSTYLTDLLNIYPTEQEALQSFDAGPS